MNSTAIPAQKGNPAPSRARPALNERVRALKQVFASADLRRLLPWLGFSSLVSNVLALALPLGILQILDRIVANQSLETLVLLVVGILIALILESFLRTSSDLATGWLGARFEHNSSVAAMQRLVRVPLQRYQKEEPGTYAERVLAASKVADFYSGHALLVLFDFPFAIVFLAMIFMIGGWLVIVPVVLLTIFAILIYFAGGWMQKQVQQRNELDDRRLGFLNEVLTGIHTVKTQLLESLMLRRYERLQQSTSELGETLAKGSSAATDLSNLFAQIMTLGVVFAGAIIVIGGGMTPGGLAACMLLSVRSLQPLRRALAVWMRYQAFVVANERLNTVMQLPFEPDTGKADVEPMTATLELRNVSLAFDSAKPLFTDLSLTLHAGEFIAVRGESGCGKSSLLSLMNGFLRPSSGEVLIDDKPLGNFSSDSVYQEVALLPQTGSLVAGTILENLTMFDSSLNQEALRIASRLGLDRSVSTMKMGYETPLGEGANETIPTGLRQVIIFVRALVRKPSVILFDEANTSLDQHSDQLLRDYLSELKGQCAAVLVTPRPSLISLADKVYTLANGTLTPGAVKSAGFTTASKDGLNSTGERPEGNDDPAVVIRRQFSQESDLSICLKPLLEAVKWEGRARELAEAMPHLVPRLDLSNLCSIMTNLGHHPRHLDGNLVTLSPRLMPCLFVPANQGAQVILEKLPNGKLRVFDSTLKAECEVDAKKIDGEIYVFRKDESTKSARETQQSWIGTLLWRMRRHIILVLALTLIGAVLSLATPLFVRMVYDSVLPSGDMVMGAYMAIGVVIVLVVDALLRNLRGKVLAFIGGRTDYVLGSGMFQRIINLPASSTQGASVSRQVGRLRNLERLRDFFLGPLSTLVFELPATLVLVVAIGIINPYALVVLLCACLAFAGLGFWSRKSLSLSSGKAGDLQGRRWEFLNETLTDMRTIRMAGAANAWTERFRDLSGKSVMANFDDQKVQARTTAITRIVGSLTGLMGLSTSAYLVMSGHITGGTMLATMMIFWRITGPLENLFMASTSLSQTQANITQTDRLMRLRGESDTGVTQTLRGAARGSLSFSRVSFRYTNDADPALLGISFTAEPGQLIVITGNVGAGKSSILKLIERVYVPQAGTIRLDDVDIRQLTAIDLRSRISYMPQQCELFYGSIAQNLLLVNPQASDAELQWAVEMAGLKGDIAALPEGINTRISNSKAEQLPHGFRQRLSLARVMLKPSAVVLLDEPGAGMDQIGEDALLRCLQWLRGRATVIMVSHRPGHMKLANNVIVMRQGSMVAAGSYENVKQNPLAEMI